jgi:hypothetical protein
MKRMLKLLIEVGANGRYVRDGKSLLILALDMLNARLVLPVQLSAFMGILVNEDFNLYRKGGFVFSPIPYLIHNQQLSGPSIKPTLTQVLRSYGSNDV